MKPILTIMLDKKEMALVPLSVVPTVDKKNVANMPEPWNAIFPMNDREALVIVMYVSSRD